MFVSLPAKEMSLHLVLCVRGCIFVDPTKGIPPSDEQLTNEKTVYSSPTSVFPISLFGSRPFGSGFSIAGCGGNGFLAMSW